MRIDVVKKSFKTWQTMKCCGCNLNGMKQRGIVKYIDSKREREEKDFVIFIHDI